MGGLQPKVKGSEYTDIQLQSKLTRDGHSEVKNVQHEIRLPLQHKQRERRGATWPQMKHKHQLNYYLLLAVVSFAVPKEFGLIRFNHFTFS
jgi:hypothetical protein